MLILLIVLLVLFCGFPLTPYNTYGGRGWSPLGLLLLILVLAYFFGGLHSTLHLR